MAAECLHPGNTKNAELFHIIGSKSTSGHIGHVGLLAASRDLSYNEQIEVFDSGPPLRIGQKPNEGDLPAVGGMPANAIGWIEDLTLDESIDLRLWIEDARTRIGPDRYGNYRVDPPYQERRDTSTNRIINICYSCVGFVIRCYEEGVAIVLLDTDPAYLPGVSKDLVQEIYENVLDRILHPRARADIGLPGEGPWPIVLAGYVFHALNRTSGEVRSRPYRVQSVDEAAFD